MLFLFVASSLDAVGCWLQVEYETLEGWKEDITNVRSYDELPAAAQRYVERIEELTGLPCQYIGVGPGRDALIVKQ